MNKEAVGVEIRDLVKTFPAFDQKNKEIFAADHVTLSVEPGEMVTLLGPSGCGKTSLLRMVAGFLMPSSGEIYIGNREVSKIPPNKRNVGMMFQSYALFPHLSVYENVAYGLKLKHMSSFVGISAMLWYTVKTEGIRGGLAFIILITFGLAFANLLPFPILDGGHVLFALGEAVFRRKPPKALVEGIMNVFLVLLLLLFAWLFFKDFSRIL